MPPNTSIVCNNNNSNCSMLAEIQMVLYSSKTERILSLMVFISVLICGFLGQMSVM